MDLLIGATRVDELGTVARTATAVGAVDWATERSSQLGQRMTESMAEARWAGSAGTSRGRRSR